MRRRLNRRGQGLLEYILVLLVILAALMVLVKPNGGLATGVKSIFDSAANAVTKAAAKIAAAFPD